MKNKEVMETCLLVSHFWAQTGTNPEKASGAGIQSLQRGNRGEEKAGKRVERVAPLVRGHSSAGGAEQRARNTEILKEARGKQPPNCPLSHPLGPAKCLHILQRSA